MSSNKKFNPSDWIEDESKDNEKGKVKYLNPATNAISNYDKVDSTLKKIENQGVDITADHKTWITIGMAMAHEFGESGRSFFHRVSRFYPDYETADCDKQYNYCLKSKNGSASIGSFFHHANAVINREQSQNFAPDKRQAKKEKPENTQEIKLPVFPKIVYDNAPLFLKGVVKYALNDEERDILLLGAIVSLSACFPKLYGLYDANTVNANLNLFVTAPASSGKGRLNLCRKLVAPIHTMKREAVSAEKMEYEQELATYNRNKKKDDSLVKPPKPLEQMLFIPANNSATGVFQLLADNDGQGLLFETEGETLSQAFKSDYGNYSDGFRKAFHHEAISYYRRTDREHVHIERPCFSAVLSGTPKQVQDLIPSAENGLFSRFIFYYMNQTVSWRNVFAAKTGEGLEKHFTQLGERFKIFYLALKSEQSIHFTFSEKQEEAFNAFFEQQLKQSLALTNDHFIATVRRLGLIFYRIAMLLSGVRMMEYTAVIKTLECSDQDFKTTKAIVKVLLAHANVIFSWLPEDRVTIRSKNRKQQLLEALPTEFTTKEYIAIAEKLGIPSKTAEKYVKYFTDKDIIARASHGNYTNSLKNTS